MKDGFETWCFELNTKDPKEMDAFQVVMNEMQDRLVEYYKELSRKLLISEEDALQIAYLQTRSRWTQELEDRILRAMRDGHSIRTTSGEEEEQLQSLGY